LEYLKWKGENIKYCSVCGKPIEANTGNKLYCKECAKEKEKIRKRNWKREYDKTSSEVNTHS